jgi:hypothetical protein
MYTDGKWAIFCGRCIIIREPFGLVLHAEEKALDLKCGREKRTFGSFRR